MEEEKTKRAEAQRRGLDEELVPLAVAATVAYFHITEPAQQVATQRDLAGVAGLVAIALSNVAPILGESGRPLGADELRERLYRDSRPDLDGLKIRRGDLHRAMVSLREARASF